METKKSQTRKPRGVQGRPRAFDIDIALDQALLLFWRKGYLGTSLTDLTEAMGINRPSLYAAFGNKETLFRKALDLYRDRHTAFVRDALEEPTVRRASERMMQGIVDLVTNPGNPSICLVTQSLLACADPDDPLHQELVERRAADEIAMRDRFERAISEGDLPPDADPAALARFVLTVISGMSAQAASGASRTELLQIVQTALQAIK